MVAGFLAGMFMDAAPLKQLIVPFTFLMVYPMMVTLKIKKVIEGGDTKAQILTQVINFGIIPFLAFGLGHLFFQDQPYMALCFLMAGLVPTSGMTISWTGFAKGNVAAAVKMTVIGLTLGSLATPFYVRALMGAALEVDIAAVMKMKQIAIIVFIPMMAGYLTQQALVKKYGRKAFQSRLAPRFPALSTLGVLGIVFISMALKAKAIAGSPQLLLLVLAPLAIIYALNFLISTLVGRLFLPRGDAIALVYGYDGLIESRFRFQHCPNFADKIRAKFLRDLARPPAGRRRLCSLAVPDQLKCLYLAKCLVRVAAHWRGQDFNKIYSIWSVLSIRC